MRVTVPNAIASDVRPVPYKATAATINKPAARVCPRRRLSVELSEVLRKHPKVR